MREFWSIYRIELDEFQVELEELRDLGEERVLFLGAMRWRGPASRIDLETQVAMLFTVRHGKITRSMDYLSHDEALEAVGLRE